MNKVVIFGTSLDPNSRSQILAHEIKLRLDARSVPVSHYDLRELNLPESGRPGAYDADIVQILRRDLADATHVVFTAAIYNYGVSSAAKNLLELLSHDSMFDKVVGLACTGSTRNSYMAVLSFANTLLLDFRAWIAPRFVFAIGSDFAGDEVASEDIKHRLDMFVDQLLRGPRAYADDAGK